MKFKRCNSLALLLSIAVHCILSLVIGHRASINVAAQSTLAIDKKPSSDSISVSLSHAAVSLSSSLESAPVNSKPSRTNRKLQPDSLAIHRSIYEDQFMVLPQPEAEPYYFKLRELTQKPLVEYDTTHERTLVVPDPSPQPVIVRLLISEFGTVDKVLIEQSSLSKEAEEVVINAFLYMTFHPGKIGEEAVKSQLAIEVVLEAEHEDASLDSEPKIIKNSRI